MNGVWLPAAVLVATTTVVAACSADGSDSSGSVPRSTHSSGLTLTLHLPATARTGNLVPATAEVQSTRPNHVSSGSNKAEVMVVSHGHRINASPYLDVGTGIELNFQDNLTQPIRAELPLWSCGAEGTSNPSDAPLLAPGTYQAVAVYDVSAQTVLVSKSVPLVVTPH